MTERDQVAAWKAALATRRRQQRRDRWKRPAPQITGIRAAPMRRTSDRSIPFAPPPIARPRSD